MGTSFRKTLPQIIDDIEWLKTQIKDVLGRMDNLEARVNQLTRRLSNAR